MNSNLQHIIALIAAIFISAALHATNLNKERLTLLQPLVEHDLSFNTNIDITTDSIILWEKLLSPELEKQQEYHILFPLKMMAVQALITEGNISLAVNNANSMYQQAKAIDYPFGTALALRALADTYQSSGNPQSAIESYEESLKIMQKIPASIPYLKTSMFHLILSKLKYRQMTDIKKDFAYLESLYHKESGLPDDFYLPCSYAYYYIQTNNLPKALEYLKQLDSIYEKYPYPYYSSISNYMYAGYHIESKEYDKALKEYEELLTITKKTALFRHVQLLQERAKVLVLMNQKQEACKIYEEINHLKDSLDAQSYLSQINELHTLYQIDKSELNYINIQKNLYYWSLSVILVIVVLIIIAIFRIKRTNNRLLQSQQEQEKAKKQAEKSIHTKSLFLSNMSHEIRTPLNALSGFSAILTEESIDNETKQQCNDIIQQNSELLLKLINDVIDLSSLEIGKMQFKFNECDIVALCRNVIDMVEKIKQTQAEVRFSTSLSSLKLTTDSARLQQVLINLLINATKFTAQGTITLELVKQTEDTALFSVSDTGCGISKENQNKIFNRFEKLDENAQGTGLGLSICQLIIEQLGGKIWIDPDYDKGARFLFTHPICHAQIKKEETR
ncbi:tetratricopeptide repeat-containing sensor histidine kinase [Bacteroides thetaiotaomicron]|uniref:tetratricopeptide repeat-containing sensor histidine kinase n=1 Tax=Bacteroides thetaiotaomicron TaxID=818 RepID=UPI0035661A79